MSSRPQCAKLAAASEEGGHMEDPSRNIVLLCEECGERTVLGGPLAVWRSASTSFGCECGERLTLSDRLDHVGSKEGDEARAIRPYR